MKSDGRGLGVCCCVIGEGNGVFTLCCSVVRE